MSLERTLRIKLLMGGRCFQWLRRRGAGRTLVRLTRGVVQVAQEGETAPVRRQFWGLPWAGKARRRYLRRQGKTLVINWRLATWCGPLPGRNARISAAQKRHFGGKGLHYLVVTA